MDFTHFAFAFFVFVLLCAVVLLYARLKKPAKQEENPLSEREKKLFTLYQHLEDMMNSIEEYVEDARKKIQQDKDEITTLCARMEKAHEKIRPEAPREAEEKPAQEAKPQRKEKAALSLAGSLSKSEMVKKLKEEGYDEDGIARELEISRGEVALILGINKNGRAPI